MKILTSIIILLLTITNSFAMYYGIPYEISGDNLGGVSIINGDTPFPTNAVVYGASVIRNTIDGKYLKVVNGMIVEKTASEKAFVDLPIKYKKQVNSQWVEMTDSEKALVDLDPKYKNPDGSEMTAEQKKAVDDAIEANRQNAKSNMLKAIENLYVQFLTVDWTNILRANDIIASDATITVTNTDSSQNIVYLLTLRAKDRDAYVKFASEFKLFEDGVGKLGGTLADCTLHN